MQSFSCGELSQWKQIETELTELQNQLQDEKTDPPWQKGHSIIKNIENLLKMPFSKLKFADLRELIEKIKICSCLFGKRDYFVIAMSLIDIAIRIISQYDQNQKALIESFKTIAAEFISTQIKYARSRASGRYSEQEDEMRDRARTIAINPQHLIVYFIYINSRKPDFTVGNHAFDDIFETAMLYRNKAFTKALLLCSKIAVEKRISTYSSAFAKHPDFESTKRDKPKLEFLLACKAELAESLQASAFLLKLNERTRTVPFFQTFTATNGAGNRNSKTISNALQKHIVLGALDPDLRGLDEDFLMQIISATCITLAPAMPERKEQTVPSLLFKTSSDDLLSLDYVADAAIRNFGFEYGRGKDGMQHFILAVREEAAALKNMLKTILWNLFKEERTDKITAFLVKEFLGKLGREKQYPELTKLEVGLKQFIAEFNKTVIVICEKAAEILADRHGVQLTDKTIHRLSLRIGAKFASKEFFEYLNDPKFIKQFIAVLGELLNQKYIITKAELDKTKPKEIKEGDIDPHSERNNPELFVDKYITDNEITKTLRDALSPQFTPHPDLSSETLRVLM